MPCKSSGLREDAYTYTRIYVCIYVVYTRKLNLGARTSKQLDFKVQRHTSKPKLKHRWRINKDIFFPAPPDWRFFEQFKKNLPAHPATKDVSAAAWGPLITLSADCLRDHQGGARRGALGSRSGNVSHRIRRRAGRMPCPARVCVKRSEAEVQRGRDAGGHDQLAHGRGPHLRPFMICLLFLLEEPVLLRTAEIGELDLTAVAPARSAIFGYQPSSYCKWDISL